LGALSAAHTDPQFHRSTRSSLSRLRTGDTDRHVAARMRERRIMLGVTQNQLAELVGITRQEVYKYERGVTGVGAGHLYRMAQALGVEVGYPFGSTVRGDTLVRTQGRRLLLELVRSFIAVPVRRHQEAIVSLARALAEPHPQPGPGSRGGTGS
jgi:transcriptional regulator with XRE-family HTH domain